MASRKSILAKLATALHCSLNAFRWAQTRILVLSISGYGPQRRFAAMQHDAGRDAAGTAAPDP
jgi:hypothetical protein